MIPLFLFSSWMIMISSLMATNNFVARNTVFNLHRLHDPWTRKEVLEQRYLKTTVVRFGLCSVGSLGFLGLANAIEELWWVWVLSPVAPIALALLVRRDIAIGLERRATYLRTEAAGAPPPEAWVEKYGIWVFDVWTWGFALLVPILVFGPEIARRATW
ncbi:MAG: hypothetical protein AAFX00_06120 [Pseudomonadota bacterium]